MAKNATWNAVEKEIKKNLSSLCKRIATQIRDDLTEAAEKAIAEFYASYNPISYDRNYWNFENYSYRKYYYNNNNKRFIGGVQLTPGYLFDLYEDDTYDVYESFFSGFHGPINKMKKVFPDMIMKKSPLEMIYEKRNEIIKQLKSNTYKIRY